MWVKIEFALRNFTLSPQDFSSSPHQWLFHTFLLFFFVVSRTSRTSRTVRCFLSLETTTRHCLLTHLLPRKKLYVSICSLFLLSLSNFLPAVICQCPLSLPFLYSFLPLSQFLLPPCHSLVLLSLLCYYTILLHSCHDFQLLLSVQCSVSWRFVGLIRDIYLSNKTLCVDGNH